MRLACAFGGAPYAVEEPEKIFERVASWAWISSPMTVSHSLMRSRSSCVAWRCVHVPVGHALQGMSGGENARLAEGRADDLQPDGQATDEAARHRHPREPRESGADRVDGVQGHGDGVRGLGAGLE